MSRSQRPRKAYRPGFAGRPVMAKIRRDLILPAWSALEDLRAVNDPARLEGARHTLAAALNYMHTVCLETERDAAADAIEAGKRALVSLIERHERLGVWRCTGPEIVVLREAILACDLVLPLLRTDQLARAIQAVDAALFGIQQRHEQRLAVA